MLELAILIASVVLLDALCVLGIVLSVNSHNRRLWRGGDGRWHRR